MFELTSFRINKLHGYKTYDLKFNGNTLILVGENGAGKTTVLRILYYFLSGQWNVLGKFRFDSISAVINDKRYLVKNSDLANLLDLSNREFLMQLPPPIRRRLSDISDNYNVNIGNIPLGELEMLCSRYDIPFHIILRELDFFNEKNNNKISKKLNLEYQEIKNLLGDTQILYLPTYRRIEQELSTIFKGLDDDDLRHRKRYMQSRERYNSIELVEFGMKDVERSIESMLNGLKEFARENLNSLTLGYLGDVVDEKYSEVDVNQIKSASNETIKNILGRIDKKILSDGSKKHLFDLIEKVKTGGEINEHAKVICHYFIKLLNFQQELGKKELSITQFCEVCNSYMEDKIFEYASSSFSFSILPQNGIKQNDSITTDQLSSGEKQIVSLFSHLYLTEKSNYFVLIDEPELSLSVPWQRKILANIKNGEFCSGLIAVTHSPFIYENELSQYAHGLGEFLVD